MPEAENTVKVRRGRSSSDDIIWDRIRAGFGMPDLQNSTVREKELFYTSRPDYMERMAKRSNKYLFHVIEEIERRGMPTELGLLPFVESAFNPNAVSSAKAAGMWQFIPSTGRDYSLRQNFFRDDRRDILHSTRAALDYLQRLYNMFGDWHLALASYNWGEGNVQRAIRRNQAAGLGTRYEDLTMPRETREYVPKLQALKNIVRSPGAFNATLPSIANHPYFDKVAISRDMDVEVAAKLAGISVADFRALNPASNRSLIIASVTPHILLPWDSVRTFKNNLAAVEDRQLASWTVWVPSETVSLEQAAEQTGATVDELRAINRIPARVKIKAGSTILVPRAPGQEADIPSSIANTSVGLRLKPEERERPVVRTVALRRTTVKARKGDTIASLAARYGLSPAMVARWNSAKPGQKLAPGKAVVLQLPQGQAEEVRLGRRGSQESTTSSKKAETSKKQRSGKKGKQDARGADSRTADKRGKNTKRAVEEKARTGKTAKAQTAPAGKKADSKRSEKQGSAAKSKAPVKAAVKKKK